MERKEDPGNAERDVRGRGFWGVEAAFRRVKGVVSTTVGYTGGLFRGSTYEDVGAGRTGQAEGVEVEDGPSVVSDEGLLNVFWETHDPTTLNRQGPDVGTQYRSAIFYHTPEQRTAATASRERLQQAGMYRRPLVTEITPASEFTRAEEYH